MQSRRLGDAAGCVREKTKEEGGNSVCFFVFVHEENLELFVKILKELRT